MFFDKPKSHRFRPANNWVASFCISLSSLRCRISRRSRSFSLARPKSSCEATFVSRCAVIHLFSVDIPTPKSSATCLRVSPPVSAIRTASCQNSSVRFSPTVGLLCCNKFYQWSGIKPRQVQFAASVAMGSNRTFTAPLILPSHSAATADTLPVRFAFMRSSISSRKWQISP